MPLLAQHHMPPVPYPAAFARAARHLADEISSFIQAPTLVLDGDEQIVAASAGLSNPQQLLHAAQDKGQAFRLPFDIDGCRGFIVAMTAPDKVRFEGGARVLRAVTAQLVASAMRQQDTAGARTDLSCAPKDQFIAYLLDGAYHNELEALELAQLWGIDLSPLRSVVVVEASTYIMGANGSATTPDIAEQYRRAETVIAQMRRHFSADDRPIFAYLGQGRVALLRREDGESRQKTALAEALERQPTGPGARAHVNGGRHPLPPTGMRIAAGNPYSGIRGLSRSFQEALAALQCAHPNRSASQELQPDARGARASANGGRSKRLSRFQPS